MKFAILLAITLPLSLHAETTEWQQVPEILSRIVAPTFPAQDFNITNFGAVADGKGDCSKAISRAIDACAKAGGGHVVIPAGKFLTGPVRLKSNVDLHLETNAVLAFSTKPKAYLPVVLTRFEGMECYNYSPFIYTYGQTNVAITGEGTLDGQADKSNWLRWTGKSAPAVPNMDIKTRILQYWKNFDDHVSADRRLTKMVANNTPVDKRRFGNGSYLRPDFIQFNCCENVLVEGVKIRRSPMWEIHPLLCTNVTVRGVDIMSHGANNDGCDPECCKDVLIEKCIFDTGDDCIAIKSGRNNDGRRVGVPSQDLVIRNCTMRDGHGGVTVGSEISGSCSNVFAENCEMSSTNLDCVLRLKSNALRGGVLQNIFMRNVKVATVKDSVLQIDFLYEKNPKGGFKPVARNVVMENISVARTPRVLNVVGFPGAEISDVWIYDSTFAVTVKKGKKPKVDVVKYANVGLVNCKLETVKDTAKEKTKKKPKTKAKVKVKAKAN